MPSVSAPTTVTRSNTQWFGQDAQTQTLAVETLTVNGTAFTEVALLSDLAALIAAPATLITLPDGVAAGQLLFVSDANLGVGTITFWDGADWIDIKTGLAVV